MSAVYKDIVRFIRTLYSQPDGLIPLHAPVFQGNETKYLEDCIKSTYVSSVGKYVDRFEEKMAEYSGAKHAVACVNGTSALHLALKLVGVGPETEVITQPLTFIATANAILYCGARPVFVDVDLDTMGLSPGSLTTWLKHNSKQVKDPLSGKWATINAKTGRKVAACIPVHTFGHPCRIDEIVAICNEHNIMVVEDAAESLGSFYKNQHTGTFGAIGVLSFNGNKIVTTGGGGMLLFQDEKLAKHAKHLSTQAKIPHPWEYNHDEMGYNYRMPNINAALGLAQLEQLPVFIKKKRTIASQYKEFFDTQIGNDGGDKNTFFVEPPNSTSNYWLNCILFPDKSARDDFLKYSNEQGIMTRPAWKLMNDVEMFIVCETGSLYHSVSLSDRLVNIPSSVFSI